MFEKLKSLLGRAGSHDASAATDAPDELPRMQFAAIAAKVGMPEEKVAMMAQMVRQNGMADSQMGFMMQTATAKGVTCEEIMSMLISMGVAPETAQADACRMEHAVSPETFEKLKEHIQKTLPQG